MPDEQGDCLTGQRATRKDKEGTTGGRGGWVIWGLLVHSEEFGCGTVEGSNIPSASSLVELDQGAQGRGRGGEGVSSVLPPVGRCVQGLSRKHQRGWGVGGWGNGFPPTTSIHFLFALHQRTAQCSGVTRRSGAFPLGDIFTITWSHLHSKRGMIYLRS